MATEQDTETGRLLNDRRAHRLVNTDFHRDEMLTTKELAAWLGVTVEFLEGGRTRGYGPNYKRLTDKLIRYRVGDVFDWLKARTYASTREYSTVTRQRRQYNKARGGKP